MNEPQMKPTEADADAASGAEEASAQSSTAAEAAATANEVEAESERPTDTRIAELEAEVATLKEQLLRALAETENVRRRAEREREDTAKFAVSGFAKDLLTVADNLRRALEAVPADAAEGNDLIKTLIVGVEATERQLLSSFEKAGIRKIDAVDQPFDPNFHQVMFEVEKTGKPAGTIVQLLQPGYTIHGRLLREAMVGVAKGEPGGQVDTTA